MAEVKDGQTMILAMLLVRMINPRCKRLHMELDEGLVHRDTMNAHEGRPESVLRHRNPAERPFGGYADLWNDGGGVVVCET